MPELDPVDITPPETAPDDPRLGGWLARQDVVEAADIVIVGFPSDEGVRRNGGRPGAAEGPHQIRQMLYRLTPDARNPEAFEAVLERTADIGDVRVMGDLENDQEQLATAVSPLLDSGKTVVILGGGHETSFGHFLGYAGAGLKVDVLNFDAHADVRPLRDGKAHSGSPFRQAVEHPSRACARYRVAGLQPHSSAAAHLAFVRGNRGETYFRDEVTADLVGRLIDGLEAPALVTFDLDAVDVAGAPGVSAPNPSGLSVQLWLEAAYRAGSSPAVRSMDVAELNPRFDIDGRTARLAALTVWHFLRGLARRVQA
jgi:formiminoglutamase